MITVKDILAFLDSKAPLDTQLDFDNAGFLCGDAAAEVTRVLVALDITTASSPRRRISARSLSSRTIPSASRP